jgi:hypothetical protein
MLGPATFYTFTMTHVPTLHVTRAQSFVYVSTAEAHFWEKYSTVLCKKHARVLSAVYPKGRLRYLSH